MIRKKILKSPAPSIRADSSMAMGMVWKNFWKMKHPMEIPDTYTSARPKRLFRPMVRRIKNSGRTLTCMGTIIPIRK